MNELAAPPGQRKPTVRDLAWTIRRDRDMPRPPQEMVFVGDGDFVAIGAEFLTHMVEIGGLLPTDRMLDIGSGMARLALPLTRYLDPVAGGSYVGIDPVKAGIDWSNATLNGAHPNFSFRHVDIRHAIYNPEGALDGRTLRLPFDDGAFDFIAMVSVVTHLPAGEVEHYAAECARLLHPDGLVFVTAFVMDKAARALKEPPPHLHFKRAGEGPEWHGDAEHPTAAVAFDDGWLESVFARAGLALQRRDLGHWRGGPAENFQDIHVFGRDGT
jgi:SAM-dependent methyltransferase